MLMVRGEGHPQGDNEEDLRRAAVYHAWRAIHEPRVV